MRERHRRLRVLIALVLVAAIWPASPVAAADITFDVLIGTKCVTGRTNDGTSPLTVSVLDPDGRKRGTETASISEGSFRACFSFRLRSGDRVRAIQGPTERIVRIPTLTLAVDRVTDVVRGQAPRLRSLTLTVTPCLFPDGASCSGFQAYPVSSDRDGRFRRDMTSLRDIIGGEQVAIIYLSSAQDRFWRLVYSPSFAVIEPNKVTMSCPPAGTGAVSLRRVDGRVRASVTFASDPDPCILTKADTPTARRFKRNGRVVDVAKGNVLKSDIASDARFLWPDIWVRRDGTGAVGHCFPVSRYVLESFRPMSGDLVGLTRIDGTTQGDGTFARPSTAFWSLAPGDLLRLTCQTGRGDRAVTALTSATVP